MFVRKPSDWLAALLSAAVTGGMLAAVIAAGIVGQVQERLRPLTVVTLVPAAPAPAPEPIPAAVEPESAVSEPIMSTPVPIIQLPTAVLITVAPDVPVFAPSTPAPATSGAAGDAPPAPITPPGFDADYLNNPPPRYPPASRRVREEGEVLLKVLVSAEGRSQQIHIAKSSGHVRLDDAARSAVRRWRFTPAQQAGQAVIAWVLVPLTFSLS